jgi:hypothetical protein
MAISEFLKLVTWNITLLRVYDNMYCVKMCIIIYSKKDISTKYNIIYFQRRLILVLSYLKHHKISYHFKGCTSSN